MNKSEPCKKHGTMLQKEGTARVKDLRQQGEWGGIWLARWVDHAPQSQGCEFKPHVGHGAYFKKIAKKKKGGLRWKKSVTYLKNWKKSVCLQYYIKG